MREAMTPPLSQVVEINAFAIVRRPKFARRSGFSDTRHCCFAVLISVVKHNM